MTRSKIQISNKSIKSQIPIWTFVIGISFVIWNLLFGISCYGVTEQAGLDIAVLKAGVGARALGMGGAFTAVADNCDAPYWNPAGLSQTKDYQLTTMQTKLSTDADHYYVSYVMPLLYGGLGISWVQVGMGSITQTSGTTDAFNDVETLGIFSYYSNAYLLSYGQKITEDLSFGITAKYLTSDMPGLVSIEGGSAYGYSITPGILYKPMPELSIGLKIDELINSQKWGTDTEEIVPSKYRLGISYLMPLYDIQLLLSGDMSQINKEGYVAEAGLGAELKANMFSLRLGYAETAMTAGIGFRQGYVGIDYAYVAQTALTKENVHRVSLTGYW
jgi:hypothetical protein